MNAISEAASHRFDKIMLHKNSDDDVLLCYGRWALPLCMPADRFASWREEDRAYLASFYKPGSAGHVPEGGASCNVRYLRTIPIFIRKAEVGPVADQFCLRALSAHYREVDDGYLLSSRYVNELEEAVLARAFGQAADWIGDLDRMRLGGLLKNAPGLAVPEIFYATFYNDLRNYFFYRKHHEHVPGTMLIEAARQGYYAQFYSLTGIKPGEVSISMDSLDAQFMEYTNPNYPVRIMVEDADPNLPENNQRQIYKRATFQQAGKVVGRVEMRGHVMKIRQFKRMRNISFDSTHRFSPVKNVSRSIVLVDHGGNRFECALEALAVRNLTVSFPRGCKFSPGQVFDYVFFVEGVGFIEGKAKLPHPWENSGGTVELLITDSTEESEERLLETIKNFTHVLTAQGVF